MPPLIDHWCFLVLRPFSGWTPYDDTTHSTPNLFHFSYGLPRYASHQPSAAATTTAYIYLFWINLPVHAFHRMPDKWPDDQQPSYFNSNLPPKMYTINNNKNILFVIINTFSNALYGEFSSNLDRFSSTESEWDWKCY